MKNLLLRSAIGALRPFISKTPSPRSFLVVTTTGLGDTLWATPALTSLRDSFPHSLIEILTTPLGEEVLRNHPAINQIHTFHSFPWRRRYTDILLFHASQRWVLPAICLLGATRIVGTQGLQKGLDDLLTDPLPNCLQHEIERRLAMVEQVGGRVTSRALLFPHNEPKEPGLIALHPGAKEPFRRWPIRHFIELGKRLKTKIVVTGTPGEPVEEIARAIPGAVSFQGSIGELGKLLARCELVISNDTGPFHLAIAVGTLAVGLYCPTDPALCGPYHTNLATVVAKRPTCTPCLKKKCPEPFCLLQISVDEVLESVQFLRPNARPHLDRRPLSS